MKTSNRCNTLKLTSSTLPCTPADLHSLRARLDFTQTWLGSKRICLTGGLSEPIFRTATARSEPAAQLAAGGEKLERTGGRAPAHVWSQFGTDSWRMTSKARLWTWQAATATVFESSYQFFFLFYQDFMVHLGLFLFIYFFFLQHQEYDLAVHPHADMVTLTGLLLMLIYMGCACSWAPDDIPHGSRWY